LDEAIQGVVKVQHTGDEQQGYERFQGNFIKGFDGVVGHIGLYEILDNKINKQIVFEKIIGFDQLKRI